MRKRGSPRTLTDVARLAHVGVATVSRVVNGGEHVSPETRRRVEAAIAKLGYLPNHAARILKGGRTKIVGLLVPSIADSFFASCAEAAGEIARNHDSLLVVAPSSDNQELELASLQILMRHRPDGLLIVPSDASSKELSTFVENCSIPVVAFDRPILGSSCTSVLTNNYEAARDATEHLIGHGYKRILCLGEAPGLFTIRERLRGYRRAMKKAGLVPLEETTLGGDVESAKRLLSKYLSGKDAPDAILGLKNSATIVTFQALGQLGVAIPSSIALLGFDDFALADAVQPPITVVQQPIGAVGRRAAELLFAQLEPSAEHGKVAVQQPSRVVLPCTLVLRESCGCKALRAVER